MGDDKAGRLAALGGLLFFTFTGVVGLLILLMPGRKAPPAAPSADFPGGSAPSVFGDTRSSARLQAEMAGRGMSELERASSIDKLKGMGEIDARLKSAEERLAAARARLARSSRGGSTWSLVKRAENLYFSFKKSERFKNSKALARWKSDFLSYPDLKEINGDYYNKDGSTIGFLTKTLRSPNFGKVVAKNINQPDIREFLNRMAGDADVMKAAKVLTADYGLQAAMDELKLPGLGSIGQMKKAGEEFKSGKREVGGKAAMEMMGLDADMLDPDKAVQKALQKSAPPAREREGR